MESRPQNPEFRNNPKNSHPYIYCNQQWVNSSFCLNLNSFPTCGDKLQIVWTPIRTDLISIQTIWLDTLMVLLKDFFLKMLILKQSADNIYTVARPNKNTPV